MRRRIALTSIAAGVILWSVPASAQAPALHVIASNGVREVIEALLPQGERAAGHPLMMQYGSTTSLLQTIGTGAQFDAVILTSEAIDQLIKDGKVVGATRVDIARAGIGVGVRAGAPKPDVSSPDTLKKTLLNAKSITYARDGASRVYLEKMFDGMGIANDLKPKILLEQGSVRSGERVADGSAQLVMTLVSEILPMHGVDFVAPLPSQLQSYVSFAAGVGAKSDNTAAAKALIKFLTGPSVAPTYKAKGMEQR